MDIFPSHYVKVARSGDFVTLEVRFFLFLRLLVNNHVKIHQSAIQKYTTLETAKIQKACYKSLLYHEDLKMVYFSVAMAVYFWMAIYRYERSIRSRSSPIGLKGSVANGISMREFRRPSGLRAKKH